MALSIQKEQQMFGKNAAWGAVGCTGWSAVEEARLTLRHFQAGCFRRGVLAAQSPSHPHLLLLHLDICQSLRLTTLGACCCSTRLVAQAAGSRPLPFAHACG